MRRNCCRRLIKGSYYYHNNNNNNDNNNTTTTTTTTTSTTTTLLLQLQLLLQQYHHYHHHHHHYHQPPPPPTQTTLPSPPPSTTINTPAEFKQDSCKLNGVFELSHSVPRFIERSTRPSYGTSLVACGPAVLLMTSTCQRTASFDLHQLGIPDPGSKFTYAIDSNPQEKAIKVL